MQFRYKPGQRSYIAFESAARSMLKAAEDHKDVLVPYGLSGTVTASLTELLDRFAKARELCDQGRIAHKTATQQLDALAQDLGSIIRTMDARNRVRYKDDPQTLAKWVAASAVLGTRGPAQAEGAGEQPVPGPAAGAPAAEAPVAEAPVAGAPAAGGDVRPAARSGGWVTPGWAGEPPPGVGLLAAVRLRVARTPPSRRPIARHPR
jgi:hypothetical protein